MTLTAAVPGAEPWADIEMDRVTPSADRSETPFESHHVVRLNQVDDVFFEVFDLPILIGRGFDAGDFEAERATVIVNRSWVREVVDDPNPLGYRFRYTNTRGRGVLALSESERWYEIVGVVADLDSNKVLPTMYHPATPGQMHPATRALRVGSNPASVAARLREISTALDPTLRADELRILGDIYRQQAAGNYLGASALVTVTLSVLLLSAAGMYAFMSFTVNQCRREIGIRAALGAQPQRLLAVVGPALRALRVDPTEALRDG